MRFAPEFHACKARPAIRIVAHIAASARPCLSFICFKSVPGGGTFWGRHMTQELRLGKAPSAYDTHADGSLPLRHALFLVLVRVFLFRGIAFHDRAEEIHGCAQIRDAGIGKFELLRKFSI